MERRSISFSHHINAVALGVAPGVAGFSTCCQPGLLAEISRRNLSKRIGTRFWAQEMNALLRIRSSVESFDENGPMASWKVDETAGESQVIPTRITERE